MSKLSGLIAAPFTPLDSENNVAFEKVAEIARLYEKNGVTGAFIIGSTGECASLTYSEKMDLIEQWGKDKGDNLKVISMVGGTCIKEMKNLARHAQEKKMDGISMLCPYYFKPKSVADLVEACKMVAASAPELPFYYYHIPSMTGGYFPMLPFLQLAAKEIPTLAGIKYTHYDLFDFQSCKQFAGDKYSLLWGTDEALLSGLVAGADGAVGSTYNYAAPLYTELLKKLNAGDLDGAQKNQRAAVAMVQILMKYGGGVAGKGFMKLIGLDCGENRLPLQTLDDHEILAMKKDLKKIDFFNFCSKV
jgi:N-acetylneuraminate lyase